ncbi:MAG: phage GP46 family protein [Ramlibacter sp.]|nr:phage GP46 family protein [Ramlibacter sp.]
MLPAFEGAELVRDLRPGLLNAAYIRIATPLGSWWADRSIGSRLHELQREKDLPRVGILAKQYAEQALQPMVVDGRVSRMTVTTVQPRDGRLLLSVELVDAAGEEHGFDYIVKVA